MPGKITTGYKLVTTDIGDTSFNLIEKDYLMDLYPGLLPTYKQAGLFLWGSNDQGQLGNNSTTSSAETPIQPISYGSNWKTVHPGDSITVAIKTDGTLWGWGYNGRGQLGDNSTIDRSSPIQIGASTDWRDIYAGSCTIAIKNDGSLWTWGYNFYGALGDNSTINRSSPIQIGASTDWKQISISRNVVVATKTDGTIWGWGYNLAGELGINNRAYRSSPVQIGSDTNWKYIAAGESTAAIKTDGSLWAWGDNGGGSVGDNTTINRSSPIQIGSSTDWKYVRAGQTGWFAIKTDGTLWTVGDNFFGELGDGTRIYRSSPVQTAAGGNNWKYVCPTDYGAVAIKTDGTLWRWGYNHLNTALSRSSPVQVDLNFNWKKLPDSSEDNFAAIAEFGDF